MSPTFSVTFSRAFSNDERVVVFECSGGLAVRCDYKACFIVFRIHRETEKCTRQTEYSSEFQFQKSLGYGNSPCPCPHGSLAAGAALQQAGPSHSSVCLPSCPAAVCSGRPAPHPCSPPGAWLPLTVGWLFPCIGGVAPHARAFLVTFITVSG